MNFISRPSPSSWPSSGLLGRCGGSPLPAPLPPSAACVATMSADGAASAASRHHRHQPCTGRRLDPSIAGNSRKTFTQPHTEKPCVFGPVWWWWLCRWCVCVQRREGRRGRGGSGRGGEGGGERGVGGGREGRGEGGGRVVVVRTVCQ